MTQDYPNLEKRYGDEFVLSEKRLLDNEVPRCYYLEEDVKEFIKRLKEEMRKPNVNVYELIDTLAGEELC
jgi:hypothetical protein